MPRKANVKVVHESETGLNDRISINGKIYTNNQAYKQAELGNVPGYHGVNNNGTKYIRSNPDSSTKNNLED